MPRRLHLIGGCARNSTSKQLLLCHNSYFVTTSIYITHIHYWQSHTSLSSFLLFAPPCAAIPNLSKNPPPEMSAPRPHPRLPRSSAAERLRRKEHAESQYPDFPSVSIDDHQGYDSAVKALLSAAGIARLKVDVSWDSLSCRVPRQPPSSRPENVFSAFSRIVAGVRNGWAMVAHPHARAGDGKETILDGVSGYLKAGETLLVLGPSGAGSSLLLARLGHRDLGSLVDCHGEVLYNGQERLGGVVNPAHIAPLIGQTDIHAPELTVRETLQFAAECKVPDWFPYAEVLRRNSVTQIARVLGIERVLDTIVGSESLRGVSGGERKRVTIAEMAMSQDAAVVLADNWSKGLDSATTLSICREMQRFARFSPTVFVSAMGAPGMDAFETFSHLCVLDSGKCLYFGPRAEAEAYFLSLGFTRPPGRSVPDFCSTISDARVNEQYVPAGVGRGDLPLSADALAARYASSAHAARVRRQLDGDAVGPAPPEQEDPPEDPPEDLWRMSQQECLQSLPAQFRAVWKRQLTLLHANRKAYVQALGINFFFGVILGSIFWQIDPDFAGAQTRGGLIFLASLFIGLNALSLVPEKAVQKQVYTKMRASAFFTPLPYISSLLVYDMVTQLLLTMCFAIPLWTLSGMQVGSSIQRYFALFSILYIIINFFVPRRDLVLAAWSNYSLTPFCISSIFCLSCFYFPPLYLLPQPVVCHPYPVSHVEYQYLGYSCIYCCDRCRRGCSGACRGHVHHLNSNRRLFERA